MLPYLFIECISKDSPYAVRAEKDFVVIYPTMEEEDFSVKEEAFAYHMEMLIYGYMEAAKRIIMSIYSVNQLDKIPCSGDDCISLPILHLYSHALELALKLLLSTLNSHSKKCDRLNKVNIENVMKKHDLSVLMKSVKQFLSKNDKLHEFIVLEEISNFVSDFESIGINSFSTRYPHTRENEHYPLRNNQLYLNLNKMNENIKSIINEITGYVFGKNFYYCEGNCFSNKRIYEFEYIASIMEENFETFTFVQDKSNIDECETTFLSNLYKKINSLNETDLCALVVGLRFGKNGADATDISDVKGYKAEYNIKYILQNYNKYQKGLNNIQEHIAYLKRFTAS